MSDMAGTAAKVAVEAAGLSKYNAFLTIARRI
jgi:hypothetical protein